MCLLRYVHGVTAFFFCMCGNATRDMLNYEGLVGAGGIMDGLGLFEPEGIYVFVQLRVNSRISCSIIVTFKPPLASCVHLFSGI